MFVCVCVCSLLTVGLHNDLVICIDNNHCCVIN